MTLDLGHLREFLTLVTAGAVPALRIAKEWLAALQSIMILFASIWRFYCNEGRSYIDEKGNEVPPVLATIIFAWGSFFISSAVFGVIVWGLLVDLPAPSTFKDSSIRADIISLQVLTLTWLGYPICAMVSRLAHWGVPGNKYNATWSAIKDVAFAFLDVTSKGGLAIFFVLKATWVDSAGELALIAAANNSLA